MMKKYLFSKEHFAKIYKCNVYDLRSNYISGELSRLLDHGFIADRACCWGIKELEGHEFAVVSRTYLDDDEINNPPKGLRCFRLPNCVTGKDDLGIAIATVIVDSTNAAKELINYYSNVPAEYLIYAIPIFMQGIYKIQVGLDEYIPPLPVIELLNVEPLSYAQILDLFVLECGIASNSESNPSKQPKQYP